MAVIAILAFAFIVTVALGAWLTIKRQRSRYPERMRDEHEEV